MLQSSMVGQKALCTSDVQFHPSMCERLKKTEECPELWSSQCMRFFYLSHCQATGLRRAFANVQTRQSFHCAQRIDVDED